LGVEPARIIQARRANRDKLRGRVGFDRDRRAALRAKTPMSLATRLADRAMEAE
jgi:hypothetical protein